MYRNNKSLIGSLYISYLIRGGWNIQSDLQAEVLLCPNCKEEVPKTLYCLNCGYPLYKIEVDQPEPEEDAEVIVEEADLEEPGMDAALDLGDAVLVRGLAEDPEGENTDRNGPHQDSDECR